MTRSEILVTGKKLRRFVNGAWERISFWHKASDCVFDDNMNAEEKLGKIKGITTSTCVAEIGFAADAKVVSDIHQNLTVNGQPFIFDYQNGKFGYNTDLSRGANSFNSFEIPKNKVLEISGLKINDCPSYCKQIIGTVHSCHIPPNAVTSGEAIGKITIAGTSLEPISLEISVVKDADNTLLGVYSYTMAHDGKTFPVIHANGSAIPNTEVELARSENGLTIIAAENHKVTVAATGRYTTLVTPPLKVELIALADTEEKAREIAELYEIELLSFGYGTAVYITSENPYRLIALGKEKGYPSLSFNHSLHI